MKHIYEGLVEGSEGIFEVSFPDLGGIRTSGSSYEDMALMASDMLETYLSYLIESGRPVPRATFGHKAQDGQELALFSVSAPIDEPTTMTVAEAAELIGVSRRRINAMIANGILTAVKEGRDNMVTMASVDARLAAPQKTGRPRKEATLMRSV